MKEIRTDMSGKAIDPGPPDTRVWHEKRRYMMPLGALIGFLIGVGGSPPPQEDVAAAEVVTETVTEQATETVTETVTEEVTATPEPAVEDLEIPDELQEGIGQAAMETAWEQNSAEEKEGICLYYNLDKDLALDSFYEGAGEDTGVSKEQAKEFFDGKCS